MEFNVLITIRQLCSVQVSSWIRSISLKMVVWKNNSMKKNLLLKQKPHRVLHPFAPGGFVVGITGKAACDPVITLLIT